jgi:hypothetical protein
VIHTFLAAAVHPVGNLAEHLWGPASAIRLSCGSAVHLAHEEDLVTTARFRQGPGLGPRASDSAIETHRLAELETCSVVGQHSVAVVGDTSGRWPECWGSRRCPPASPGCTPRRRGRHPRSPPRACLRRDEGVRRTRCWAPPSTTAEDDSDHDDEPRPRAGSNHPGTEHRRPPCSAYPSDMTTRMFVPGQVVRDRTDPADVPVIRGHASRWGTSMTSSCSMPARSSGLQV